jgi:hypothetical protein
MAGTLSAPLIPLMVTQFTFVSRQNSVIDFVQGTVDYQNYSAAVSFWSLGSIYQPNICVVGRWFGIDK